MIEWPSSLPGPAVGTLAEGSLETKVSDQGEVGAPRRRNRFTRALARFQFEMVLTGAQKDTVLAFYDDTLTRGVEAFEWTHPSTSKTYLVVIPARPAVQHVSADVWSASIELDEI